MKIVIAVAFVAASLAGTASAAANSGGASFLTEAMQGDNSETALGALAARRGTSEGVRRFGAMLAADHSRGKAEAVAVARKLHVPVTDRLAPEAVKERLKLAGLTGRAFDREFARYMVDDHRKDIAKFTAETSRPDQPAIVALARKTIPVLRKHLATAKSLAG
jgi:putative membrane protein